MKSLILFGSKYGTTEASANKLKGYLQGEIDVINIKNKQDISLNNYERVIMGTSVYAGMINKDIKSFIESNKAELINKKIGL
ncbi:MAG: flavodoxin domain-containing protein, partial [Clostridium sp.]